MGTLARPRENDGQPAKGGPSSNKQGPCVVGHAGLVVGKKELAMRMIAGGDDGQLCLS